MQDPLILSLICLTNLVPVLLWAWVYLSRDPTKEPRILLLFAFVIGALTTLPVMLINSLAGTFGAELFPWTLATMVVPVLGAALVEEVCKHAGVVFVMRQNALAQDEVLDGIVYSVITALGFAFVENTVYIGLSLWGAGSLSWDLVSLFILRSMLSMFAHTIFSGLFGYYYALAFIEPTLQSARHRRLLTMRNVVKEASLSTLSFRATHRLIRHGHTHKPQHSLQLLLEGLWLGVMLHMLFNLFLTWPPFAWNPFLVVTPYVGALGIALMVIIVQVRRQAR